VQQHHFSGPSQLILDYSPLDVMRKLSVRLQRVGCDGKVICQIMKGRLQQRCLCASFPASHMLCRTCTCDLGLDLPGHSGPITSLCCKCSILILPHPFVKGRKLSRQHIILDPALKGPVDACSLFALTNISGCLYLLAPCFGCLFTSWLMCCVILHFFGVLRSQKELQVTPQSCAICAHVGWIGALKPQLGPKHLYGFISHFSWSHGACAVLTCQHRARLSPSSCCRSKKPLMQWCNNQLVDHL